MRQDFTWQSPQTEAPFSLIPKDFPPIPARGPGIGSVRAGAFFLTDSVITMLPKPLQIVKTTAIVNAIANRHNATKIYSSAIPISRSLRQRVLRLMPRRVAASDWFWPVAESTRRMWRRSSSAKLIMVSSSSTPRAGGSAR